MTARKATLGVLGVAVLVLAFVGGKQAVSQDLETPSADPIPVGQTPVVVNLFVPTPAMATIPCPITEYTDLPESDKTVTLPAGGFVIIWDIVAVQAGGVLRMRPVVGDTFPAEGLTPDSGSWAGHTDGGTMTVKLQAMEQSGCAAIDYQSKTSLSWTLVVFPTAGSCLP